MGFLDKVKNLFTDEIEEEVPVKKEVIKVEITPPQAEESNHNPDVSDNELLNREEKSTFPVFDDSDFDDLIKPNIEKPSIIYGGNKEQKVEEKKEFKLSPIISPVYGILDKNYTKDDITTKPKEKAVSYENTAEITIDEIRKKAYGTLEEDLETELFSQNSILFKEQEEDTEDLFLELEENTQEITGYDNDRQAISDEDDVDISIEKQILQINNLSEPELEKKPATRSERNMVEEELERIFEEEDKLNEGDLFNLIDSMYEEGED